MALLYCRQNQTTDHASERGSRNKRAIGRFALPNISAAIIVMTSV
jgi:hypothetical protein